MKKRKIFGLVIFALFLTFVTIFSISRSQQKSSFDDSDLVFSRPKIPVESNAFWDLSEATNKLYWPEPMENRLFDLSQNTNWDDSLATEVLTTNKECLNLFDESFSKEFLLVPEAKIFDDYPYLEAWRDFSLLDSIRIVSLFRSKNEKTAFDESLNYYGLASA
jgi:hypothetical protein